MTEHNSIELGASYSGDSAIDTGTTLGQVVAALARASEAGDPSAVREVLENAVDLSRSGRLRLDFHGISSEVGPINGNGHGNGNGNGHHIVTEHERREQERENIVAALRASGGRIYGEGGAAKLLGLKPSTLSSRMKAFKIRARDE
jgi:transcriptional regulator with GAF, ATPase, and Fis domain